MTYEFFGIVAGTLLFLAYIPQILRAYRLKRTDELSLSLFVIVGIASLMWIIYGFIMKDNIIIVMNGLILGINQTLVAMKLRYDKINHNNI